MRLNDKVAIITGASGGIGGACAKMLAREGAKVVLTDVTESSGKQLAAEIGGDFLLHDVSEEQQWTDVVVKVLSANGRIDILVNLAAIEGNLATDCGPTTSLLEWRRVMRINLDGTFLGCRAVWSHMNARGVGSIVNMSSAVSFAANPVAVAYSASKAAVDQLTRSFAMAGAEKGKRVRCNSVHPGSIKTRMTDDNVAAFGRSSGLTFEQAENQLARVIPFRERGTPEDVAAMVVYLASDESAYVTGASFRVDGGLTMVVT